MPRTIQRNFRVWRAPVTSAAALWLPRGYQLPNRARAVDAKVRPMVA